MWIETASGKQVDLRRPEADTIVLADIWAALPKLCRYTGQCSEFYSVGQHSLLVTEIARILAEPIYKDNVLIKTQMLAMLHDGHEAYIGDISTPLKIELGRDIREIQARLQGVIQSSIGLSGGEDSIVQQADKIAQMLETEYLMPSKGKDWYTNDPKIDKLITQDMRNYFTADLCDYNSEFDWAWDDMADDLSCRFQELDAKLV